MKKTIFAIVAALLISAGIIGVSTVVPPYSDAHAECGNGSC